MQTDRSIPELTRDVAFHLGDMLRNELKLARVEAADSLHSLSGAILTIAAAIAVGAAALTMGLMAAAYGLSLILPMWAAAAIVAAVAAVIAVMLFYAGRAALRPKSLSLPKTREQVSRDFRNISEHVH